MNPTDESASDEALVPAAAPEPVPYVEPDLDPDVDVGPPVDPDAPCPFFPAFANGLLNWCARRVANARRRADKLPPVLAAPVLTVLSFFGFFLGAALLHAAAVVGIVLAAVSSRFAEYLPGQMGILLFFGFGLGGVALQVFLLIRIALKVRNAAGEGRLRVFNSYFELVGNALLVLFVTFFGVIMFLYCFFEPSAERLSSLVMLFVFFEGVSAVGLALLVHSCYVRNRHLGWKTAFAVVIAKYVASWFSYFCVMRIWTAIQRILHPVGSLEAAENRWHDRHTMNENAKRGRTEETNVVAEVLIATAITVILKKTIAPLVTGRPEGEPNGFAAAMRDFRAWRAGRGAFLAGTVVSFLLLCVGLAYAALSMERHEAATIKAEQKEQQQAWADKSKTQNALKCLGDALRSRVPNDAIPPVGAFSSSDDYFKALARKGLFKTFLADVVEAFCHGNEFNSGRADWPKRYTKAFEESGLFSAENGGLPPVLRVWTVLAGEPDNVDVPFFWMSSLGNPLSDLQDLRTRDGDVKKAKIDAKIPFAVIADRMGQNVNATENYGLLLNDHFSALGRGGEFQLLEPENGFDRETVRRYLDAVAAAEKAIREGDERAAAEKKSARDKEAMRFFEDGEPEAGTAQATEPEAKPEPAPKTNREPEPAPEPAAETESAPKPKTPAAKPEDSKPTAAPAPAKTDKLAEVADRQAAAYQDGTKSAGQILKWLDSPKVHESKRERLRALLVERGVPLADAERKEKEEAKRKADEDRKAAEEAKRKADEERKAAEEAKRKADEERKAAEEAKRKAAEERRAAEFKKRQEKAEAERLKRQEEARKRQEEADRQAKEEADRERKRKDKEERDRQKALDEFTKSMQKMSEASLSMDARGEEEEDVDELEEANADNPFFRNGTFQGEAGVDERRAATEEGRRAEERRRRAEEQRAAREEQRRRAEEQRAARDEQRRRVEEANARRAAERKRAEERNAEREAAQVDPYAISPIPGDGTIEDDPPPVLLPKTRSAEPASRNRPGATPPAMPDAMVEQLATGIRMSVQGGQMTPAQAAFMLDNATLSDAQKATVRKKLAAEGISLPRGK